MPFRTPEAAQASEVSGVQLDKAAAETFEPEEKRHFARVESRKAFETL